MSALEERLERQRRRLALASALERLPRQIEELDRITKILGERREAREQAIARQATAAAELAAGTAALETKRSLHEAKFTELQGTRDACQQSEARLVELEPTIAAMRRSVAPEHRVSAEAGTLPQPTLAERDAQSARTDLERFEAEGPIPDETVEREFEVLARNIEELGQHIIARQAEADRARSELDACRGAYLEVVRSTLHDYARRARALAEVASAQLEMVLPDLVNNDRSIDEAGIEVRIGFDGKPPTELGDSEHSGGQRVIAGLILLMAMAETEGDGFFIVDEPFAHLSMDRVEDVGRFLRTSGSQFLITVPTTLDRGQLDPASLLVVLYKKAATEQFAKRPMVLRP